jgi:hypothetical protein
MFPSTGDGTSSYDGLVDFYRGDYGWGGQTLNFENYDADGGFVIAGLNGGMVVGVNAATQPLNGPETLGTVTNPWAVVYGANFVGAGTGLTGTAASFTAGHVTTNANLTGPITSSGNATAIASQTGTGSTFVMSVSPTLSGHPNFGGSAPAVSSCGTGSPTIDAHATDSSGTVTVGTVATGCTVTFAVAYATWNHCRVTSQSAVSGLTYAYTLSAITVSASVLGADKFDYSCDGT